MKKMMDADEIKSTFEARDQEGAADKAMNVAAHNIPKDAHTNGNACNGTVDHNVHTEDDEDDMPALIDSHPSTTQDSNPVTYSDTTQKKEDLITETKDKDEPAVHAEWMDVIGNGQLMKKILKEGQGAATRPQRGNLVTLKSKGSLEDGTEVDCHEAVSFVLGEGDVVSAWDLCLSLMDLGEVSLIKTSPRFAYGELGRLPDVPPNAEITYEMELLAVLPPPDPEEMTVEELCNAGDKKRERGNELYSRKDYSGAINSYTKALKLLEKVKVSDDSAKQAVMEMRVKCYNNLAAAQLKIDAYDPALKSCSNALNLQPENVKALFRKGKVLASQGEYEQAIRTMKEALSRDPSNKVIHNELSRLTNRESKERQSEKKLYQRMVGEMASVTQISPRQTMNKWLFLAITIGVVVSAIIAALSTQQI